MSTEPISSTLEADESKVLRLLEEGPLTLENISYAFDLPTDRIKKLLEDLHRNGVVTTMGASLLSKIFPVNRPQQTSVDFSDPSALFTLTTKGHFLLHPIVSGSASHRE